MRRGSPRIGDRYGVTARYTDAIARCSAHAGLDAVGMAVGPAQHAAFGEAALARGLPVFMEKPPAADAAGAQRAGRRRRDAPANPASSAS